MTKKINVSELSDDETKSPSKYYVETGVRDVPLLDITNTPYKAKITRVTCLKSKKQINNQLFDEIIPLEIRQLNVIDDTNHIITKERHVSLENVNYSYELPTKQKKQGKNISELIAQTCRKAFFSS